MSGYTSFSSDTSELSQLRRDNTVLREELAQCKADKDFVWSLWRRLQVANPDITQAIGLAVQREKEKWDAKEKKLSETVWRREGRIEELEKRVTEQSEEISRLVSGKLELQKEVDGLSSMLEKSKAELECKEREISELKLKDQESASREAVRELDQMNLELKQKLSELEAECELLRRKQETSGAVYDSQKHQLASLEKDLKLLDEKNGNLQQDNHQLQLLTKRYEEQVMSQRSDLDAKNAEMESLRVELSDLWRTHQQTTEHCSQQTELIQQLRQLNSDTQNMLQSQEQAFTVELAAQQSRVRDQDQLIAELRNSLENVKFTQQQDSFETNSVQLSNIDGKELADEEAVEKQISTLELELSHLKDRLQTQVPQRRSRQKCQRGQKIMDKAASSATSVTERRRQLPRSRSLSAADYRHAISPGPEYPVRDLQAAEQKLCWTERQRDEMKQALEAKKKELDIVQTAHSRRLDRLQSVLSSYQLVKKQLKLYEDDYVCAKKKKVPTATLR